MTAFKCDPSSLTYSYNLANSLFFSGQCERAVGIYNLFLDSVPRGQHLNEVDAAVEARQRCLASSEGSPMNEITSPGPQAEARVRQLIQSVAPLSLPSASGPEATFRKRAARIYPNVLHLGSADSLQQTRASDPGKHCLGSLFLLPEAVVFVSSSQSFDVVTFDNGISRHGVAYEPHTEKIAYVELESLKVAKDARVLILGKRAAGLMYLYPEVFAVAERELRERDRVVDIMAWIEKLRKQGASNEQREK